MKTMKRGRRFVGGRDQRGIALVIALLVLLALSFAGEGFRTQFEGKPQEFYAAILALGYTPIAESRSHSFGEFTRIGDQGVVQVVKFIGADQSLYEAVYQLGNEGDGGWHVLGVVLKKAAGMAV